MGVDALQPPPRDSRRANVKPASWIGLLAVAGGIIGYAVSKGAGWLDAGIGIVVGILIGALVFGRAKPKGFPPSS